MTLVVEDGTGLANANTYASAGDADDYADAKGWTEWAALTAPQKEAALIEATVYLDSSFEFIGDLYISTQALNWPRVDAYDRQGRHYEALPQRIVDVCIELAYLARSGPLVASITEASLKKIKAGPVELEYTAAGSVVNEGDKVAWINRMIGPLIKGSASGSANVSFLKA